MTRSDKKPHMKLLLSFAPLCRIAFNAECASTGFTVSIPSGSDTATAVDAGASDSPDFTDGGASPTGVTDTPDDDPTETGVAGGDSGSFSSPALEPTGGAGPGAIPAAPAATGSTGSSSSTGSNGGAGSGSNSANGAGGSSNSNSSPQGQQGQQKSGEVSTREAISAMAIKTVVVFFPFVLSFM